METASRLRTTPDATMAHPVQVAGIQRGWFARTGVAGLSTTFLGCVQHADAHTNGVLYLTNEEELRLTDSRELGYTRIQIPWERVNDYSGKISGPVNVWMYVNDFPDNIIPPEALPSQSFPIVQSYVDMCLNGCLEIEERYPVAHDNAFARDFIESTIYWNECWVNDRIYPRRPFIHCQNAYKIDALLKKWLPNPALFDQIYFE